MHESCRSSPLSDMLEIADRNRCQVSYQRVAQLLDDEINTYLLFHFWLLGGDIDPVSQQEDDAT